MNTLQPLRIVTLAVIAAALCAQEHGRIPRVPAFPGAEGHGSMTRGGRGGRVIAVTNLDDSGPGSLPAAVEAEGARIVIFRISGTIVLESPLRISHPYITIAGQTAPGDGLALRKYPLQIDADEVVIRYIRVRLGDESGDDADAIETDTRVLLRCHPSNFKMTGFVDEPSAEAIGTLPHCMAAGATGAVMSRWRARRHRRPSRRGRR